MCRKIFLEKLARKKQDHARDEKRQNDCDFQNFNKFLSPQRLFETLKKLFVVSGNFGYSQICGVDKFCAIKVVSILQIFMKIEYVRAYQVV